MVGLAGSASGADFTIETAQEYIGHSCNAPCNTLSTLNYADDRADYFESAKAAIASLVTAPNVK